MVNSEWRMADGEWENDDVCRHPPFAIHFSPVYAIAHLQHRLPRARMHPQRRNVSCGLQCEGAFVHARMRHLQAGFVHGTVVEEEDVDVDGARGISLGGAAGAAQALLNGKTSLQQCARLQLCFQQHGLVQEEALVAEAHGQRPVATALCPHRAGFNTEQPYGLGHGGFHSADVAAQEKKRLHGAKVVVSWIATFYLSTTPGHHCHTAMRRAHCPFFIFLLLLPTLSVAQTWVQIGADIDGESQYDRSGDAVSMPDVNTVAIGAPLANNGVTYGGHVRVFAWDGVSWVQKGSDLDHESPADSSGASVSMPDANTIAIGAPRNDDAGTSAGHVRVHEWNGNEWQQKGADIDGESAGDYSGWSVSMPDPNTVAIGAPWNNNPSGVSGHARVFEWTGSAWVQKGADLDGEAHGDVAGWSISMPDANTVAVGARTNDGSAINSGHVRVFEWNGAAWQQKGLDIDGEAEYDNSGWAVSMPDPNTLAVGAILNDGNGGGSGQARVFWWSGNAWVLKGASIYGEPGDQAGHSVCMPDPNTIAVGAPYNNNVAQRAGCVRVYQWDNADWTQLGLNVNGEDYYNYSGTTASMANASTIAIGASGNEDNGPQSGHVRIYTGGPAHVEGFDDAVWRVYPNPTIGPVVLEWNPPMVVDGVWLTNVLGQRVVPQQVDFSAGKISLQVSGPAGVYYLTVLSDGRPQGRLKLIKE